MHSRALIWVLTKCDNMDLKIGYTIGMVGSLSYPKPQASNFLSVLVTQNNSSRISGQELPMQTIYDANSLSQSKNPTMHLHIILLMKPFLQVQAATTSGCNLRKLNCHHEIRKNVAAPSVSVRAHSSLLALTLFNYKYPQNATKMFNGFWHADR